MISYVTLGTNDFDRALEFYDSVMATLGQWRCATDMDERWAAWGTIDHAQPGLALWICAPFDRQPASAGNGTMIALSAATRAEVHAFHAQALAAGGASEGEPGLRRYAPNFYAAYVRDPDGNKLAVVCRADQ